MNRNTDGEPKSVIARREARPCMPIAMMEGSSHGFEMECPGIMVRWVEVVSYACPDLNPMITFVANIV